MKVEKTQIILKLQKAIKRREVCKEKLNSNDITNVEKKYQKVLLISHEEEILQLYYHLILFKLMVSEEDVSDGYLIQLNEMEEIVNNIEWSEELKNKHLNKITYGRKQGRTITT